MPVFHVKVSVMFHLNTCVHITFSCVAVAEWPGFGKQLFIQLNICSLCSLPIRNISYFPFCFEVWILGSDCFSF